MEIDAIRQRMELLTLSSEGCHFEASETGRVGYFNATRYVAISSSAFASLQSC